MSRNSSVCCQCSNLRAKCEIFMHDYLQDEREPLPVRSIPKIIKPPHYDPSLVKNQRILRNFVVNLQNVYVACCLLNRKGLEYMVEIHRFKENAVIKAGSYPYCDGDYIASHHFDNLNILYPPQTKKLNRKLRSIVSETEKLALLVKCMWLKISTLEEINPKNIAFKEWTWEAIEFTFEIFYKAFFKESKILESLVSAIMHTSNFTKQQRCIQTWYEQQGIKDEELNLLKSLLQEVGVKESKP